MRGSGILLHISSLPNKYGIGTFGSSAYQFVDFLSSSNQKYWQVLPLGPTSYGDSPYQTFSAFAGNPYFIDFDFLKAEGLLEENEYANLSSNIQNKVDFEFQYRERFDVLRKAHERFDKNNYEYNIFKVQNSSWLNDYALFMAIKNTQPEGNWSTWEDKYKFRNEIAINEFSVKHYNDIDFWKFVQFEFFKQWLNLKQYANQKGIKIIGDIPIYVAYDSCDVWSNPFNWHLDENLNPIDVAGCPPDSFAIQGQLWGNPIYDYQKQETEGFSWWIKRIQESFKLYDVVRIDHFRGFESYYSIPYSHTTAEHGVWIKGPGIKLFNKIKDELGDVDIIAEDLGFLTEDVYQLLKESGFPGMKILIFGFDPYVDSEYALHNLTKHSVAYTGTHDNSTSLGWYKSLRDDEKTYVQKYLEFTDDKDVVDRLIRAAFMSVCDTVIIPIQDYLGLDDKARFNIPSTLGGNWTWRMEEGVLTDDLRDYIKELTKIYYR